MTAVQEIFNRYFATLEPDDRLSRTGILKLESAKSSEVQELAKAFVDIRTEINNRFEINSADILAPEGPVRIYMDYISSAEVNAIAFFFEGWYFIGITEGMLKLFSKSCSALWRINSLADLLGIELDRKRRNLLFPFALLLQLQYISNHELGHLFHGHYAEVRTGQYRAELDVATLVANSIGIEGQARELEADGYSINLLLKNLFGSRSGDSMHERLSSRLNKEEFLLTFFVLVLGALLYFLDPVPFDPSKVRKSTHNDGIIRMNILLGEILGWCDQNQGLKNCLSLDKFQWIMSCVQSAAANPVQEAVWNAQGEYLRTKDGQSYVQELYSRRVHLRKKMDPNQWRLASEIQSTSADAAGQS